MIGFISGFVVSFVSLFVALDAIGVAPVFLSVTEGVSGKERRKILRRSVYAASLVAVTFVLLGGTLFWIMGITIADFQIAGGILLLVLSVRFLMQKDTEKRKVSREAAVFPLATPLLTGPAVLTMLLISVDGRGLIITILAFAANMAFVFLIFKRVEKIVQMIGTDGMKAISKIVDILLSAFAVMLIRKGIQSVFF